MKTFNLLTLLSFIAGFAFAKPNSDSIAYRLQKEKINNLLEKRKQKFGQYDESLSMHSGIFGFQTKKDIRRSNDILTEIVKTDDSIYREIKVLLDFRTFQQTQVQSHSTEIEGNNLGFMNTINKLRGELDRIKADDLRKEQQDQSKQGRLVLVFILMLVLILFLFSRNLRRKT